MDEATIINALKQWATVNEDHREKLLNDCLAVLAQPSYAELSDENLEMLAAAGDANITQDISRGNADCFPWA